MLKITTKKYILFSIIALFIIILLLPGSLSIPVSNASSKDWHQDTYWYEPWGKSGVHKGIDIFADRTTAVLSPATGLVLFQGSIETGGKVILSLGPNWRLHYFAHLDQIDVHIGELVFQGETIGTVGNSGNARGKPAHLHYSLLTLVPYIWRFDLSTQGWKKIFYLNPADYFQ